MSQMWRRSPGRFGKQLIHFQRWKPNFCIHDKHVDTKLVWVRFPDLPFEYWHENVLQSMAKVIGRPMDLDSRTWNGVMGHFAHVLVEVEDSSSFSRVYEFQVERKQPRSEIPYFFKQFIVYEDELDRCSYCKRVGHVSNGCCQKEDEAKAARVQQSALGDVSSNMVGRVGPSDLPQASIGSAHGGRQSLGGGANGGSQTILAAASPAQISHGGGNLQDGLSLQGGNLVKNFRNSQLENRGKIHLVVDLVNPVRNDPDSNLRVEGSKLDLILSEEEIGSLDSDAGSSDGVDQRCD
ncbi:uncharacterized protein LOC122659372 [Telopea speciosissima]|uniref:uncharacterized protein LOC122659372 n=1 Tax=Telopea speciosissima TaxID=54955 RepID=UPI001CC3D3AA|nr:uncharacterized protein LOC122659372 [Telopea speciosissima]